jgi:CRP/FNR family transcriptional regulator, cyclic AMP receptor protein
VPTSGAIAIDTVEPGEAIGWSWLSPPYRRHFDARALELVPATAFPAQPSPSCGLRIDRIFAHCLV